MRVIFLDVDGVLNCGTTRRTINGYLFVDEDKIRRLSTIIRATNAQVVLSSTWRYGKILNEGVAEYLALEKELAFYGIEIMDCTPKIGSGYRGHEIQYWLSRWNENHEDYVDQFVILDDDTDMAPFMSHLVQTSFDDGLLDTHVEEAINVLNGQPAHPRNNFEENVGEHRQILGE